MSDQPRKNIEAMRRMGTAGFAPPIAQLIGMRAIAFDEGSTVLELDADGRHANPMGTLQCEIRDEKGALVTFATSTCMVLRGEMAGGR